MAEKVTKNELLSWIEKAIENENYSHSQVELIGTTEKGEGYMGAIIFAKVNGTTRDNTQKEINMVIKHAKPNEHLRNISPVKEAFETEIHFYAKIIPAFKKFQEERGIQDIFDAVPKCYCTLMLDNMEVLILENLKTRAFELYDRKTTLNLDHQKKVLQEYGKFHALSFAFRDQKPEEFAALAIRADVAKEFLKDEFLTSLYQRGVDDAIEMFKEYEAFSLIEKLKKVVYKNAGEIISELLNEELIESVFTHGDCWNNNFMYKYENSRKSPSKVMILDWQISGLRSPVFDVSHFVYATGSKEQWDNIEELIDIYYTSFSTFLRKLGSDPEILFPYSTLKDHWRKFSHSGIIFLPTSLKYILCDSEKAPDLGDMQNEQDMKSFGDIVVTEKSLYFERLKGALEHYSEFKF